MATSGVISCSVCQRGAIWASTNLDCAGKYSFFCSESSSKTQHFMPQLKRAESLVQGLQTLKSCPQSHPQDTSHAFRCFATHLSSSRISSRPPWVHSEKEFFGSLRRSRIGAGGCETDGNLTNRMRNARKEIVCKASGGRSSGVGSSEWLSKATPYEVLGVSIDSSEEDIKSAFRAMIKEYHPDVYQGVGDADAITQRLLRAYELLTGDNVEGMVLGRKNFDPFENPECVAKDFFVNELDCIGRGCPYSCVERAPEVFQFAPETGRARANQDSATWRGEYRVQLAVGQCPRNCIHSVTPLQKLRLEEMLNSVLEGLAYSGEAAIMDGLIARARFENGRYQPPKRKRKPKYSEEWVDWY